MYAYQSEYSNIMSYIKSFQIHVDSCYDNYIINMINRNLYSDKLSDIIKQLNIMYNILISREPNSECPNYILISLKHKNALLMSQIYDTILNEPNEINFPYHTIITLLNELGHTIGYKSLHDALSCIVGLYKYVFNNEIISKIEYYNNIFIPISYDVGDSDIFMVKRVKTGHTILLNNTASLHVPWRNKCIIFIGYFIREYVDTFIDKKTKD